MGLTLEQRHADGCELLHDREHGECTCGTDEIKTLRVAERALREALARIATLEEENAGLLRQREYFRIGPGSHEGHAEHDRAEAAEARIATLEATEARHDREWDEAQRERAALRSLIERVCPAPHLTLDAEWLAEAKELGCKL